MHHTEMPVQGVTSGKSLLLYTYRTAHFLFAIVMYCVLVARKIIRARKDSVAMLARDGIHPIAPMRPLLRVPLNKLGRRHAGANARRHMQVAAMVVALVLLQPLRRREAIEAAVVGAAVGAGIGREGLGPWRGRWGGLLLRQRTLPGLLRLLGLLLLLLRRLRLLRLLCLL